MALSLSTARMTSRNRAGGKVVSEYKSKKSPKRTGSFNGATDRLRRKGGKGPAKGTGRR